MVRVVAALLCFLAGSCLPAFTQSEENLEKHFAEILVVAKLGLPNSDQGLNVRVGASQELDPGDYARRLSIYGRGLSAGEATAITRIRIKSKAIEVHLGTGGNIGVPPGPDADLSSVGRLSAAEQMALFIYVSTRDPVARTAAIQEFENARRSREMREQGDLLTSGIASRRGTVVELRGRPWTSGSRLILRFPEGVPPEALTPEGLQEQLAPYLIFLPELSKGLAEAAEARPIHRVTLRPGMSQREVDSRLDIRECRAEKSRGKNAVACTYLLNKVKLSALFEEGVLVEFSTEPLANALP